MSWNYGKVEDIATVISGFAFKSEWFGEDGADLKVIRIGDLQSNEIVLNDALSINKNNHKISNQYEIKCNDILMALSGATVGKIAVAKQKDEGSYINQRVAIIRGNRTENSKYLRYVFNGENLSKLLMSAGGVAQPNLSPKDLAKMVIPIPPLAEQQRIAAILDKAAEIKAKREQAITKLDELANGLLIDLMNDNEFHKFPTVKLGDVLELQRGASPRPISAWMANEGSDGVNWIKIADATASDKYIFSCKEKIKPEAVKHSRFVKNGDFLLSNSMSFGKPYILRTDGCIHDGWLLLRDVNEIFIQDYLYSLLCSTDVMRQFKKYATGAVVKNLNIDAVSKVEIKLLSIEAQQNFSNKVSVIERQKSNHKKSLYLLNLQLASLQHQAFTTGFNA